jgi:hypothetical protein
MLMHSPSKSTTLALTALLCCALAGGVLSAQCGGGGSQRLEAGFTIPGLAGAAETHEAKLTVNGADSGLTVNMMKPGSKYAMITWPQTNTDGSVELKTFSIHIYHLSRYSRTGHAFAYYVMAAPGSPPDAQGHTSEVACMSTYAFFDVDGSGKFKVKEAANFYHPPQAPAWTEDPLNRRD